MDTIKTELDTPLTGEPQTIDDLMKLLAEKPEDFAITDDDFEPTDETAEELILN
jgi:hypothetical protein